MDHRRQLSGVIYLIHFAQPVHHARHYMGFATDLNTRLNEHRAGRGARLMSVVTELGIGWMVVRTWRGDRGYERRLKKEHHGPRLCPICHPKKESKQ